MRGVSVLIVLCAVAAMLMCCPALAGNQIQKDAVVKAAPVAAVVQKSASPAAGVQVVPDPGSCRVAFAVVAVAKEKIKQSARGIRANLRQGVRLNCPLGARCCAK